MWNQFESAISFSISLFRTVRTLHSRYDPLLHRGLHSLHKSLSEDIMNSNGVAIIAWLFKRME